MPDTGLHGEAQWKGRLMHCTLYGGHLGYSLRLVLALHPTTAASYRKEQLLL